MANTFLAGNLTADPEHRSAEGAKPSVVFTVAVNRRRQVNGRWEDAAASFHRCVVWADQAQRVAQDLRKGQRVIVIGELRIRTGRSVTRGLGGDQVTDGSPGTGLLIPPRRQPGQTELPRGKERDNTDHRRT